MTLSGMPDPSPSRSWRSALRPGWTSALRQRWRRPATLLLAALLGASVMHLVERRAAPVALRAVTPTPIASTSRTQDDLVAIKGQVAEIFGGRFVLADPSGRALVETGPRGDGDAGVVLEETVTVQGHVDRGALHAVAVTHADGHVDVVGPPLRGPPWHARWMRAIF